MSEIIDKRYYWCEGIFLSWTFGPDKFRWLRGVRLCKVLHVQYGLCPCWVSSKFSGFLPLPENTPKCERVCKSACVNLTRMKTWSLLIMRESLKRKDIRPQTSDLAPSAGVTASCVHSSLRCKNTHGGPGEEKKKRLSVRVHGHCLFTSPTQWTP